MEPIRDGALATLRAIFSERDDDDLTRALILRLDRAEEAIALAARSLRNVNTPRIAIARVLHEYLAWRPTHRHKRRGSEERVVAQGQLQTDRVLRDGDAMMIYVDKAGRWWVRHVDEFNDGRFENLTT